MKDLRLIIKARNNIMMRWREKRGLSARRAAEFTGVSYALWLKYEGLTENPVSEGRHTKGCWKPSALAIAEALGELPEDVWTPAILSVRFPVVQREVRAALLQQSIETVETLALPDRGQDAADLRRVLDETIDRLTPQEQAVVRARFFDEKTLEETGERIGRTKERVRQIEHRALRRLRHPSFAERLVLAGVLGD